MDFSWEKCERFPVRSGPRRHRLAGSDARFSQLVFPLSGGCIYTHPQPLQGSLSSHKNHLPAAYFVLALPEVQITHESKGLLFEKSPNSGEDWMALGLGHSSSWWQERREKKFSFLTQIK